MTKTQILLFMAFGYLAGVAGVVWLWGPWGLIGTSVVTLLVAGFMSPEKEVSRG